MSAGGGARRLIVKICGLREPDDAAFAARQGADLLGFVFAPSRRQVTPRTARRCIEAAKNVAPGVRAVGVFVDATADEMRAAAEEAGLDLLQLHGSEPGTPVGGEGLRIVRAVRPRPGETAEAVEAEVRPWLDNAPPPEFLLVDTYHPTVAGGTGEVADWGLARYVAGIWPTLLAGGLSPGNVAAAVAAVRPAGVDVSSGVERGGAKDPDLIAAFIAAARAAG